MKQLITLTIALSLTLSALVQAADEEAPEVYVYASYLTCAQDQHTEVDAFVTDSLAPIYDQAMKQKSITGWGWLIHNTGGRWSRLIYHTGPNVRGLISGQDVIGDAVDQQMKDKVQPIQKSCSQHDDYIWQVKAGSPANVAGKVGISVYMTCNIAKEDRADEIVAKAFAPVYEQHIKQGKLKSWGWLSHIVGGKYRRLATMTADNYDDLLTTREQILNTLFGDEASADAKEFSTLCTSHQDYLWDIAVRKSS